MEMQSNNSSSLPSYGRRSSTSVPEETQFSQAFPQIHPLDPALSFNDSNLLPPWYPGMLYSGIGNELPLSNAWLGQSSYLPVFQLPLHQRTAPSSIVSSGESLYPGRIIRSRSSRERDRLVCPKPDCPKDFSRSDTLARHLQEVHGLNGGKEFCCPNDGCSRHESGSGFKRRDRCRRHIETCGTRRQLLDPESSIERSPISPLVASSVTAQRPESMASQVASGTEPRPVNFWRHSLQEPLQWEPQNDTEQCERINWGMGD